MNTCRYKNPWSRHSLLELNQEIIVNNRSQRFSLAQVSTVKSHAVNSKKENFFYLEQEQGYKLFNPESSFSISWKTLNAAAIFSQAIIIPILASFPYEGIFDMLILELCITSFFILDIIIKLNTGFYLQGHLNTDRFSILFNYFKGQLVIDCYSAIPISYFVLLSGKYKYLLIPKLLKLSQIYSYLGTLKLFLKNLFWVNFLYYAEITLSVFISVHWLACLWLNISLYDVYNVNEAWAVYQLQYGIESLYIKSVYYVVMTVTTLGYGDFYSVGVNEEATALGILFVGVIIFSFNITSVINLVIESRYKIIKFKEKLMNFNIYMEEKDLPNFLRYKVRRFLEYKSKNELETELRESEILDLLSDPLREELFRFTDSGKLVKKCRIFLKLYREKVLKKLSKFFASKTFTRNDPIIQQGELSTQLYFMLSGNVEVLHDETRTVFSILKKGNYFGEIGFFTKRPRTATIRCIDIVNTLALKREDLDFILFKFPISALATKEIEEACSNGDYTLLEVKCYLCQIRGHIAAFCPNSRVSPDKFSIPQEWVDKKRKSKVIKERSYFKPNVYRNPIPRKFVKMKNIQDFGEGELFKKLSSARFESFSEKNEIEFSEENKVEVGIQNVLSSEESQKSEENERKRTEFRMSVLAVNKTSSESSLSDDFI